MREEVLDFSMRFLGKLRPELLRAIEWSLDEITDNVLNHAEAKYGGILQVDAPKKHGFLQITVADGGRGIPASMREGHPQLHYDQNAVGEAIKVGVTRSPEVGQGNGLAGALRVATFSGGVFRVNSYRGYVAAEAKPSQSQKQITRGSLPEEALYGTVVDLQIRTDTNFDVADALSVVNWVDDWGYLEAKYGTENELVFRLADETRGLGSRDAGVGIRNKLETLLAADSTRAVVLDWSGVPTISSSFADEFVGKLLVKLGPVLFNSRIRFVGMEPFVAALVDKAMRQRAAQDFARERAA
ncbi:MAG TPA: DUF4325 domain-containing protein [Solirubrobacterales bacterium]|nr:DUF4325 domain-containing protein [Solirubrobacterales bacterium]